MVCIPRPSVFACDQSTHHYLMTRDAMFDQITHHYLMNWDAIFNQITHYYLMNRDAIFANNVIY